jgi:glycosyltransferase involved in cell wall biosynthesis
MRILLHTPFKPLDHPGLSGDVTIALDLRDELLRRGHEVWSCPFVPAQWIYWRPKLWPRLLRARRRALALARDVRAQLVLTYHTYYKAPDLMGPYLRRRGLAYCIFSGAYARKRARHWSTLPGYILNKQALLAADHIFCNKTSDFQALESLVPTHKRSFVPQGLPLDLFRFDPQARSRLRRAWRREVGTPERSAIILTAAMLRPGVKVEGVAWVIHCCAELRRQGHDIVLVVAGDGQGREELQALAGRLLPGHALFLGQVERTRFADVFSAGDIFAFPGINEGLGMVYLEAQACGLPVVATTHAGARDVVQDGHSGCLVPPFDLNRFVAACARLLNHPEERRAMGGKAARFVGHSHNIRVNYTVLEQVMSGILDSSRSGSPGPRGNAPQ